nr:unnamed protein product [Spirometra erinaceieuropaei]
MENRMERTSLIIREFVHYEVDIATFGKTRLCEQGQPDENKFVKVVSTRVALEMISLDDVERQFYEEKHDVLVTLPKAEKLIVHDYLSDHFVTDYAASKVVLGKHKIGSCNRNQLLLLLVCEERSLPLNNTFVRLPMLDQAMSMHRSLHLWHLLEA